MLFIVFTRGGRAGGRSVAGPSGSSLACRLSRDTRVTCDLTVDRYCVARARAPRAAGSRTSMRAMRPRTCRATSNLQHGHGLGRGGMPLSGEVLINLDRCAQTRGTDKRHKQEARHERHRGDDSHTSQVALTPAELAPDVQQHDEGDEQQAQHEDGSRATAQREPQPLRTGVASAGAAAVTLQASDFGYATPLATLSAGAVATHRARA